MCHSSRRSKASGRHELLPFVLATEQEVTTRDRMLGKQSVYSIREIVRSCINEQNAHHQRSATRSVRDAQQQHSTISLQSTQLLGSLKRTSFNKHKCYQWFHLSLLNYSMLETQKEMKPMFERSFPFSQHTNWNKAKQVLFSSSFWWWGVTVEHS